MIVVTCKECKKRHTIRPDGLGRILPGLIFWMGELKESCCKVIGSRKQKGEIVLDYSSIDFGPFADMSIEEIAEKVRKGIGSCEKCGKPAVIMAEEGPGPFGLINYCEECFVEKAERRVKQ